MDVLLVIPSALSKNQKSMKEKIAIIGGGNLGSAIALGAVQSKMVEPEDIAITRRNLSKINHLADQGFVVTSNNVKAIGGAKLIILCVQPKQLAAVIEEIEPYLQAEQILVSTITGISISEIAAQIKMKLAIVRAMPNTAIAIGQSMTCLCAQDASPEQVEEVRKLFNAMGITLLIEERLMKAATVLAASGVAFFMRYIRAATQGGIQMGFDAEEAQLIATQTAKGAATLLLSHESHPEMEIDKVTTPEGCTIAGLNEMEHQGLSSALIRGIITSYEKIKNIKS